MPKTYPIYSEYMIAADTPARFTSRRPLDAAPALTLTLTDYLTAPVTVTLTAPDGGWTKAAIVAAIQQAYMDASAAGQIDRPVVDWMDGVNDLALEGITQTAPGHWTAIVGS
jgi:hypothetical protein